MFGNTVSASYVRATGLTPNSLYYFKFKPYSSLLGAYGSDLSFCYATTSIIKNVSFYSSDSSSITILVDGSYSYYDVSYSTDGVNYYGISTKLWTPKSTITGLTSNYTGGTGYYFKLNPYGGNTNSYGVSYTTTTKYYTLASISGCIISCVLYT